MGVLPRIVSTYREEARKRILEVALEVFREKGYFKSTMEDVSNRLGISKGAIYRYFDGKDQILAALYISGPENLRSQFSSMSDKSPVDTAKEVFTRMSNKTNANLFVDFLAEASRNEELQKVLRGNMQRFNAVLEDALLKSNPKMGPKDVANAHQVAVMLGLIFNGLVSWVAAGVPEEEVGVVWGKSVDMLLGPYENTT
jgi:AcrR family transcriptional regulator